MSNQLIKTKSGVIEYSSYGTGQAVLFIHGGHSNSREKLSHKGFELKKYRLITPSRPGYGQTPLNNHRTPRETAALFVGLLDELNIEQVIVYGISAGGLTAIELAASYPARVHKLILASAVSKRWLHKEDKTYKIAQVMFAPGFQQFTWGMVRLFSTLLPRLIAKSFLPQFSKKTDPDVQNSDIKELNQALRKYSSGKGFVNDLEQTVDDKTLKKIECPTLVIHSEYDNSVPFEHAVHSSKSIKGSVLESLKNEWGHLFWIGKDSNESIKRTLSFIEK